MFCDEPERSGSIQAGFLGPTSYSAIFSEHQSQLDVDLGDWSRDSGDKEDNLISTVSGVSKNLCSIDLGVRVLQQLPSQDSCEKLLDRFFRVMSRSTSLLSVTLISHSGHGTAVASQVENEAGLLHLQGALR